jgi:hypothetical protein
MQRLILLAACAVFAVSFWKRNDVPVGAPVAPSLADDPAQTASSEPPFTARWNGVEYRVEPQYDYELYGLVVSYRQHDGTSRMHRRANDHLNVADLCVVWGDNATNPHLGELDFWNGVFTCNVHTKSTEAWQSFRLNQMSNNHLISDDEDIRGRVREVRIGDQVRIRGQLATYASSGGRRGTSVTRDDTGDGACETIYVEELEILAPAPQGWRYLMYGSLATLGLALGAHFRRPCRPPV